ncbi:response regulator [Cohnella endophytica]|uniref:Response regulator n=1 Tax=Cohnella endophytica TaxID=2419778 RepID=A0A494XHD8_9BACL|nr:response regulator [Cohnella endophytica]RKP49938.1 response regulator [Cohnella endophytica]
MKVMIVDDEPIFMMGIRKLITDYNSVYRSSLEVVSEVYDGKDALEQLPAAQPDIVFTDIRMATVDGLALAKQIQEHWPRVNVVIVSGYPSFENAREAFKANAVDFIQKPVNPELFHEMVRKLELRHKHDLGKQALEQLWLRNSDQDPILRSIEDLLGPLSFSFFLLRVLPLNAPSHVGSLIDNPFRQLIVDMQSAFEPDSFVWLIDLQDSNEMLLAIASPRMSEGNLQDVFSRLRIAFPSFLQAGYRCNLAVDQLKDMKQLHTLFHKLVTLNKPSFVRLSNHSDQDLPAYAQLGSVHESKIRNLIGHHKWDELDKFFERMFSLWEHEGCSIHALERNLKKLTGIIVKCVHGEDESLSEYAKIMERLVRTSPSYRALNEQFAVFVSREWKPSEASVTREEAFVKIRAYLSSHLNEPTTLGALGDLFGVSISYLCSIFKEFSNATFVEFLTEMRLQKAAELLRTTSLPLKEVAELTGYADQRYFSKVFKSHSGMTPSEFKSANRGIGSHPISNNNDSDQI